MLIQQSGEVEQRRIHLVSTSHGLLAQRATHLFIPDQTTQETATTDAAAEPSISEEKHSAQPDESGVPSKAPRTKRGFQRRSTRQSTSSTLDSSGAQAK
jgi:hypothetical protein